MIAGGMLWAIAIGKMRWRVWGALCGGLLLALALGVGLDRLGYGEWVFSAWNYLRWQVLEGNVNRWGVVSPFLYLQNVLLKGAFPISLVLAIACVAFWFRFPLHVLTWVTLPFVGMHFLIGHKEERFLFPMIAALPLQVGYWVDRFEISSRNVPAWCTPLLKGGLIFGAIVNFGYLIATSGFPARNEISLYAFLYDKVGTLYFQGRLQWILSISDVAAKASGEHGASSFDHRWIGAGLVFRR
jgi:phosphatidylinositol glycan class B